jgi:hypothetical protein
VFLIVIGGIARSIDDDNNNMARDCSIFYWLVTVLIACLVGSQVTNQSIYIS